MALLNGIRITKESIFAAWRDWFDPNTNQMALDVAFVPPLSRTATGASSTILSPVWARGIMMYVNVTAVSGTSPTLAVALNAVEPVGMSNKATMLTSASITATGLTLLTIYPGVLAVANSIANQLVPAQFQIAWTIGGTTPNFTFSVGFSFEP